MTKDKEFAIAELLNSGDEERGTLLQCLEDAQRRLNEAIDRQRQQESNTGFAAAIATGATTNTTPSNAVAAVMSTKTLTSPNPAKPDDPDAVAAAFLSRHAKQQEDQTKLPVDEWATVIVRKYFHENGKGQGAQIRKMSNAWTEEEDDNEDKKVEAETTFAVAASNIVSSTSSMERLAEWHNPCELVRRSCRRWMEEYSPQRCLVTIRYDQFPALTHAIVQSQASEILWDEGHWHYRGEGFTGSASECRERVALYILALDAINFCFWPLPHNTENEENTDQVINQHNNVQDNPLEYEHVAKALKSLAEADHGDTTDLENYHSFVFSPHNLSAMTASKLHDLFDANLDLTKYPIPNLEKRALLWKELGDVLLQDYDGLAMKLVETANGDASRLVELIVTSFPGFQDHVVLAEGEDKSNSCRVVFLKRAQILVADIDAALDLQLHGMDRLTTFADYRVPQVLRHWDVLDYSPTLAAQVDQKVELRPGSLEEISIRAATVVAVEELVQFIKRNHEHIAEQKGQGTHDHPNSGATEYSDVKVDWYLWQVGEKLHSQAVRSSLRLCLDRQFQSLLARRSIIILLLW